MSVLICKWTICHYDDDDDDDDDVGWSNLYASCSRPSPLVYGRVAIG